MNENEDVFDEDLIRELGLDPEDVNGPKAVVNKKPERPVSAKPMGTAGMPPAPPRPEARPHAPAPAAARPAMPQPQQPPRPPAPVGLPLEQEALKVSQDIPILLTAVIGKKTVKLKDVVELKTGELIEFKKMPNDPIDIVANGKLIAKAELVVIDGKVGVRIQKLIK